MKPTHIEGRTREWDVTRYGWFIVTMLVLPGCTTFATVHPARVQSGPSFHGQITVAAPPGELPGWIWSFDCAEGCNHAIPGFEIGASVGASDSTGGFYLGGGAMAPLTPYVEAYWQFSGDPHPSGVGARAGIPVLGQGEYRVFYRRDFSESIIANTNVVVATGRSRNDQNSATFVALLQSVGVRQAGRPSTAIPSVSIGIWHTSRRRYNEREEAFGLLAVASVGVLLRRPTTTR